MLHGVLSNAIVVAVSGLALRLTYSNIVFQFSRTFACVQIPNGDEYECGPEAVELQCIQSADTCATIAEPKLKQAQMSYVITGEISYIDARKDKYGYQNQVRWKETTECMHGQVEMPGKAACHAML